jgi:hypothetical protein
MWCDREGEYLAQIIAKAVKVFDSGATAIVCDFETEWIWNGTQWENSLSAMCRGNFFVIGKEGAVLTQSVERFVAATGWNGDLEAVDHANFPRVKITVKAEQGNNGRTYYKAAFIDPEDAPPGGGSKQLEGASPDQIRATSRKYGALLKGIATKAKPAAAPPPAVPLPPPSPAQPEDDDIPF